VITNKATFYIKSFRSKTEITPESVETAVINANIEKVLSKNMAKKFD